MRADRQITPSELSKLSELPATRELFSSPRFAAPRVALLDGWARFCCATACEGSCPSTDVSRQLDKTLYLILQDLVTWFEMRSSECQELWEVSEYGRGKVYGTVRTHWRQCTKVKEEIVGVENRYERHIQKW